MKFTKKRKPIVIGGIGATVKIILLNGDSGEEETLLSISDFPKNKIAVTNNMGKNSRGCKEIQ